MLHQTPLKCFRLLAILQVEATAKLQCTHQCNAAVRQCRSLHRAGAGGSCAGCITRPQLKCSGCQHSIFADCALTSAMRPCASAEVFTVRERWAGRALAASHALCHSASLQGPRSSGKARLRPSAKPPGADESASKLVGPFWGRAKAPEFRVCKRSGEAGQREQRTA